MSDKSAIEWTDATWNPIKGTTFDRWMCQKISPGCDNCYASTFNQRWGGMEYPREGSLNNSAWQLDEKTLHAPLRWKRPRRIFVCSMTDLFGDWVPDEWLDRVFYTMAMAPQHTFQVLTKRPARMRDAVERLGIGHGLAPLFADTWPLPNVQLGVSVELDRYTWRAKMLADIPAAVRFVSAEPLLGPLHSLDLTGIHWVISGGESSGPVERQLVERCDHKLSGLGYTTIAAHCLECPSQPRDGFQTAGTGWRPKPEALDWVRDLRDRSQANGTAFFHKQWGGRTPKAGGRLLDGREWNEYPAAPA